MRKLLLAAGLLAFLSFGSCTVSADSYASEIPLQAVGEDGAEYPWVTDGSYDTMELFSPGTVLHLTAREPGQTIWGLYLTWAAPPENWCLLADGAPVAREENHYLHQYAPIPEGAQSVSLVFPDGEALCYVKAYSRGLLPEDVQIWEPPCTQADVLLFPAHADDEILFFGGVLAEYAGERGLSTQVVYFSEYYGVREHEKLDGLWACGVRNYPVNAPFPDVKPETPEEARELFDVEQATAFLVEQLRRFRPQIVVGHDVDGEYGHETHKLVSWLLRTAVACSMDENVYPDSAAVYGVWDVPKTYLHLWDENPIRLNCRKPLDAFGGRTAVEAAALAYTKHVSQQWCWFYVSDDYEYSIADFGLYRTTVGSDTGNDMMESLTSYAQQRQQERLKKAQKMVGQLRSALGAVPNPELPPLPTRPSLLALGKNALSYLTRECLGIASALQ